MALAQLPGHVRATFTFFLTQDQSGLEMALALNDLRVVLDFPAEGDPRAVARAIGMAEDHLDGWRFMTEAETADYIERRNRGDIDDLVEEL